MELREAPNSNDRPAHCVNLPSDIQNKTDIVVKVHAVVDNGNVLMVEYKDTNIPVIVQEPDRVKDFFRGDKLRIHYTIAGNPGTLLLMRLN